MAKHGTMAEFCHRDGHEPWREKPLVQWEKVWWSYWSICWFSLVWPWMHGILDLFWILLPSPFPILRFHIRLCIGHWPHYPMSVPQWFNLEKNDTNFGECQCRNSGLSSCGNSDSKCKELVWTFWGGGCQTHTCLLSKTSCVYIFRTVTCKEASHLALGRMLLEYNDCLSLREPCLCMGP